MVGSAKRANKESGSASHGNDGRVETLVYLTTSQRGWPLWSPSPLSMTMETGQNKQDRELGAGPADKVFGFRD